MWNEVHLSYTDFDFKFNRRQWFSGAPRNLKFLWQINYLHLMIKSFYTLFWLTRWHPGSNCQILDQSSDFPWKEINQCSLAGNKKFCNTVHVHLSAIRTSRWLRTETEMMATGNFVCLVSSHFAVMLTIWLYASGIWFLFAVVDHKEPGRWGHAVGLPIFFRVKAVFITGTRFISSINLKHSFFLSCLTVARWFRCTFIIDTLRHVSLFQALCHNNTMK